MPKSWYSVTAGPEGSAELYIYDEIGMWGISASDMQRELRALGDVTKIVARIHSPGGSVFEGLAIYTLLKAHKAHVTVKVDGIAASIASYIAMAGDVIEMPANTFMMIHDPSGGVHGKSEDMREIADLLDKVKGTITATYARRSNRPESEVVDMMAKETLMTAAEAKEAGFADLVTDEVKLAACAFPDALTNLSLPEHVATAFSRPTAATPTDKEKPNMSEDTMAAAGQEDAADEKSQVTAETARAEGIANACNDAGCAHLIPGLIASGATIEQAKAKANSMGDIRKVCAEAKKIAPDLDTATMESEFIASGVSAADARAALWDKIAARDEATQIVDRLSPTATAQPGAGGKAAVLDPTAIYAKRNRVQKGA